MSHHRSQGQVPLSGQPFTMVPPLGCSTWPVIYEASFEARNT